MGPHPLSPQMQSLREGRGGHLPEFSRRLFTGPAEATLQGGSHALWAQPGFRAAGAAVSAEKDLEMSPSNVMSDGAPVLHHKQGFTLWPQTT